MSDSISRQAAIRWVKTECNPYGKPTLDFESGKKVIEHLEQMPSADIPQGWIPCSEKMPEPYQVVLVSLNDEFVTMSSYRPADNDWTFYAGARLSGEYPVAWMPLPKPWKGADDE